MFSVSLDSISNACAGSVGSPAGAPLAAKIAVWARLCGLIETLAHPCGAQGCKLVRHLMCRRWNHGQVHEIVILRSIIERGLSAHKKG